MDKQLAGVGLGGGVGTQLGGFVSGTSAIVSEPLLLPFRVQEGIYRNQRGKSDLE